MLKVDSLTVHYHSRRGIVKAVNDVSFTLGRGEILGVCGESGCGKTTLGLALIRLLPQNAKIISGKILLNSIDILSLNEYELSNIRWSQISMIFQGAMNALNPVKRIGDQLIEPLIIHGKCSREKAFEKAKELLRLVGIDPVRINSYPHTLSGGMRQRVLIAMALICSPKVVIADEPFTALDVMTQAQIIELIKELREKLNLSIILITHDLALASELATKIMIMYAGRIMEYGWIKDVCEKPLHPYTQKLIKAIPSLSGKAVALESIPGSPPSLINMPKGCPFNPRCSLMLNKCREKEPALKEMDGRYVACHRIQ